jgi:uncharacterized protein YndB with AHSA1/START domain
MHCAPEDVFAVLNDGWLFPAWVVGASRMRDVSPAWPQKGSRLHHSFGVWPFVVDDSTSVLEFDPPHRIVLQARGWPIGEAHITIDVKPRGDDCVVRIQEVAAEGPGSFIPQPLLDLPLHVRNAETLRRLAHLAEGGAGR